MVRCGIPWDWCSSTRNHYALMMRFLGSWRGWMPKEFNLSLGWAFWAPCEECNLRTLVCVVTESRCHHALSLLTFSAELKSIQSCPKFFTMTTGTFQFFCHLVLHWTPQLRTDWSDIGLHWVWPGTNQGHQDLETHWSCSNSPSLVRNQKWSTSLCSDEQNAGGGSDQSPMLHEWAWPLPSTRTAVPDQENQVQPLRCSTGTSLEANSGVIEPETSQIVLSATYLPVPCSCCRKLTCWCCTDCWTSPAGTAVYLCPSNW